MKKDDRVVFLRPFGGVNTGARGTVLRVEPAGDFDTIVAVDLDRGYTITCLESVLAVISDKDAKTAERQKSKDELLSKAEDVLDLGKKKVLDFLSQQLDKASDSSFRRF